MTDEPGCLMAAEIAEQPAVLARVLDRGTAEIREVAQRLRDAVPRFVLIAGRGTSDHAALYAKYLVEVELGLPAGLASPSTMTGYGGRKHLGDVLWLAVSQSGESPDLVASTEAAGEAGALTVAVTNAPESPLAAAARLHVDMLAGPERAVAATKSYTAELLTLFLLVRAWQRGDLRSAASLPDLAARVLDLPATEQLAASLRDADTIVTTARGFAYPTAREVALKLMETCYISSHAFSGADLLHGPQAMIDHSRPVLAIVSGGTGGELMRPVLERLRELGADLTLVGPQSVLREMGDAEGIPLPEDMDERLAPIVQVIPLQQVAHRLAVHRGLDPDRPRGLRKVTRTL